MLSADRVPAVILNFPVAFDLCQSTNPAEPLGRVPDWQHPGINQLLAVSIFAASKAAVLLRRWEMPLMNDLDSPAQGRTGSRSWLDAIIQPLGLS